MQVGKNGRKIPLDPATELPHDCPMRDKPQPPPSTAQKEEKKSFDEVADQIRNDHGNETVYDIIPPKQGPFGPTAIYKEAKELQAGRIEAPHYVLPAEDKKEFVDHTLGTKGYFKAFAAPTVDELNEVANSWLRIQNVRFKQWGQLQVTKDGAAIALYYEECLP